MNSLILIVVVIYEINFEESQTLQSLRNFQTRSATIPDILIYDNSSSARYHKGYLNKEPYYQHDPLNGGVGGAYNFAAKLALGLSKQWLVLFDQDTTVNNNYFDQFQISLNKFPNAKLFCPTVLANNKIISPAYYLCKRAVIFTKPKKGLLKSRYFTIINSGMAIKVSDLRELGGYDNDLPLDYSDHYFFYKYKKRNKNFVALDCTNRHSLSATSDHEYKVVYNRFRKYCHSTFIFSQKTKSIFPLIWLYVRTSKLTFKFLKFGFIKFLLFKK